MAGDFRYIPSIFVPLLVRMRRNYFSERAAIAPHAGRGRPSTVSDSVCTTAVRATLESE